jgi:hypothetical protein
MKSVAVLNLVGRSSDKRTAKATCNVSAKAKADDGLKD